MDFIGYDLFTSSLQETLQQFKESNHFGSLIRPEVTDVAGSLQTLADRDIPEDLFLRETHKKVRLTLRQVEYLSPRYHVVIANPPYMGSKGMNGRVKSLVKREIS